MEYRFLWASVGAPGSNSNAGVVNGTSLENRLGLPDAAPLPGDDLPTSYFMIGDNAFPLRKWMQTPFSQQGLTHSQRIFKYRTLQGPTGSRRMDAFSRYWHFKIHEKAEKWYLSYFNLVFSNQVYFTYLSYYSYLLTKYLQYKCKTWIEKHTLLVNINLQKWYFVAFCNLKLMIITDFSLSKSVQN